MCRGEIWRKSEEGLKYTSKGSKNLPGGRTLHLLVGICHSRGAVMAEEYEKLTGSWFAQYLYRTLQQVLMDCAMVKNNEHLLFVMENPSQRSSKAHEALHEVGADLVEMPPR